MTSTQQGYLLAFITISIWAGFVVLSREGGLSPLNPFDMAALRIGVAAVLLSPWWLPPLWRRAPALLPWRHAVLLAVLVGMVYPLLAYGGLTLAPASHGGVLLSGMLPAFTAGVVWIAFQRPPTAAQGRGLLCILFGVAALFWGQLSGWSEAAQTLPGDLMLLGASLSWAMFTVLIRHWGLKAFDVMRVVVVTTALLYLPLYIGFLPKNIDQAPLSDIALQGLYQGGIVVCVAMWTYAKAAELLGATRLVAVMSLVPVLTALLAIPVLGETLTPTLIVGVLLAALGAWLAARAAPR